MDFIEIEWQERENEWSMSALQSHEYYEVYILLGGSRRFFLEDKVFEITPPTICVIPPFRMHKTEGNAYKRVNINVSTALLSESETSFLSRLGESVVYAPSESEETAAFLSLLERAAKYAPKGLDDSLAVSFTHVLLHLLSQCPLTPLQAPPLTPQTKEYAVARQAVAYINRHFHENFSVQDLCETFFLSKNALCAQFRAFMRCSIMQYRTFIRISKAKELLASTNKDLNEIAEACGFSSANYFSLIFKKEVGLAPSNYRKSK